MQIIHCIIADAVRYVVAGAVGYGFSIVLGLAITYYVVEPLRKIYGPRRAKNCVILPIITGALDRFLYTTAWLTPYKAFIGIWLLVKVARAWKVPGQLTQQPPNRKTDKKPYEVPKEDVGRYNIFIIGNALCVIFGVLGGIFIEKILECWPR